ncbi:DUF2071 domain-containing protein [Georgenia sp. TF02-10]|uniref:YqjF family protein n=1 Tax=Georgenia sp. TF02-10 TaxID=2917725 RepID=UPI001FA7E38D|nr:DUF2071 domain-containing protein [Georgenia sp. TF02-10]UNX55257.1 DUF2071 domain-containing protein [Georgenia sp. TF02-10]
MSGREPDQPVRLPVNLQRWERLTFLHWRYDPAAVRPLLPPGLVVDTFDGAAWVGVTPFRMRGVRPPLLPAVPHLSSFPEVNVRTYVRTPAGVSGLWFLSLDCPRLPVVAGMRALGLPYQPARMHIDRRDFDDGWVSYRSARPGGRARMRATVRVGAEITAPTALVNFLTGRWNAFTRQAGRLWRVPAEHDPWPLHAASAVADVGELVAAGGLPAPVGEPLVHFSPGVHARLGAPRPA